MCNDMLNGGGQGGVALRCDPVSLLPRGTCGACGRSPSTPRPAAPASWRYDAVLRPTQRPHGRKDPPSPPHPALPSPEGGGGPLGGRGEEGGEDGEVKVWRQKDKRATVSRFPTWFLTGRNGTVRSKSRKQFGELFAVEVLTCFE